MEFSRDINNLPLFDGKEDRELLETVVFHDTEAYLKENCGRHCVLCEAKTKKLCFLYDEYKCVEWSILFNRKYPNSIKPKSKSYNSMSLRKKERIRNEIIDDLIEAYEEI